MRAANLIWPLVALLSGILVVRMGASEIAWGEFLDWLRGASDGPTQQILSQHRLPRTIAAALVGATFAAAGMILQVVLRNPLADPTIFGISGGASLALVGAFSISLALGPTNVGIPVPTDYIPSEVVPLIAMSGAVLATMAMLWLSRDANFRPRYMALNGVILGSVITAIVMTLVLSLPEAQTQIAILWMAGSLYGRDLDHLLPSLPLMAAGLVLTVVLLRPLSLLRFDGVTAAALGLELGRMRLLLIIASAGLAASAVSVAGPIGFVGLLVPHITRQMSSPNLGQQLWLNIWIGAILVMWSDGIGRTLLAPVEMPVGIVTSLIGAPFLIYLLTHRRVGG